MKKISAVSLSKLCGSLTARDGADHRAVGKDADHSGRAIEAGIVEQFVDNERAGLLRAEILGRCNSARSQGHQDGRVDERPAYRHRHHCKLVFPDFRSSCNGYIQAQQ